MSADLTAIINKLIENSTKLSEKQIDDLKSKKGSLYYDLKVRFDELRGQDADVITKDLTRLFTMSEKTYGEKIGGNKKKSNQKNVKYMGGNYKVHIGPRGGEYIMHKGSKVYVSK
jgi:hypothetical protein